MKISIIIPIYNEQATLEEIVSRVRAFPSEKEIILVDDGSIDDTKKILEKMESENSKDIKILRHQTNQGKGAAVRTGLRVAKGDITLVQDADLEYDPAEYIDLLKPFKENQEIQVVYGSRILGSNDRFSFTFYWGGRFLSLVTNLLYNAQITDEPTGYKVFRTSLLKELNLKQVKLLSIQVQVFMRLSLLPMVSAWYALVGYRVI